MAYKTVKIRDITAGRGHPLFLVAGPCVIENEKITMKTAVGLKEICSKLDIPLVFKSSFDKANRTSISSFRGPGLEKGLALLARVKKELELPILTDVHTAEQVEAVARVADVLQIPAFLCRQTDFLAAVARSGKVVNIKKGQFLAPWDMKNVAEKIESTGNTNIILTERGASFGYNNLVVDFRSFPIMRETGYPVVFDATHSVQLPGGLGNATGGQRRFIGTLTRAAVAAGIDGLFMEVHPEPEKALCDSACMFRLSDLEDLLETVRLIRKATGNS